MTLSTAALLATLAMTAAPQQEMRLMRYPAVHGEDVLFTYASDLWIANRGGGLARRLTSHPNLEFRARVSPDGKWIAFTATYDGNPDVYVMPFEGGEPKRLTFEADSDNVVGWTPDGRIAYISTAGSNFGGLPRLWLISPNGGVPQGTPVLEASDVSFSPDGKKVAYHRMPSQNMNWRRYRGGMQGRISIYDLEKNAYSEIPSGRENSFSPMWIGNAIYYGSDKEKGTVNLFRYDVGTKKIRRLTDFGDADIKWPSTDGKTIVFERDGYLYSFDVASEKLVRLSPRVLSDNVASRPALRALGNQLSWASLSPTGVRVAVEARGELFSVPAKNGDTRNMSQTTKARERFPQWSPDGKQIAYASDASGEWEIYVVPQLGGEAVQITKGQGTSITNIEWAPNSKLIAYTTRQHELKVLEVETKRLETIAKGRYGGISAFDWSPDSKWIAYVDAAPNEQGAIFLYELPASKKHQVTEAYFSDDSVSFDASGKYLYVLSSRTVDPQIPSPELTLGWESLRQRVYMIVLASDQLSPLDAPNDEEPVPPAQTGAGKPGETPAAGAKPEGQAATPPAAGGGAPQGGPKPVPDVRIDLEGLGNRMVPLPMPPGSFGFIIGVNEGVLYYQNQNVMRYDVKSRESQSILSGPIQFVNLNAPRTKIVYTAPGTLGIVDVRPGQKVGDGKVDTGSVEAIVNPKDEWRQIFWDAWRYERDNFYDDKMLGLDWQAVGKRYEGYLDYVAHRADLTYVMGLMIGELGTSHAYLGGGDQWIGAPSVPIGQLGADYEVANGKMRFKRIYRGQGFAEQYRGPLGAPGATVNEGDYLLEIDGRPVDANTNPNSLLIGKANRFVTLTVNDKPTTEGARKVRVRPIGSEGGLRYIEWVEANRRYVEKQSGGRIGYMHVPNTSVEGAIGFVKGYFSNADKEALVVDERFNGGGYIPTFFVERLMRRTSTYIRQRSGEDVGFPVQTIDGPKAMLINGYAGSGGDHFPWLFKYEKLGPLIGTRTWGGLVGIMGGYQLIDGGSITAPEFGLFDPRTGKWIAENEGVEPDIEIDARPDLIAQGKDPQLDKVIEYLMGELRKQGPREVKRPDFKRLNP